MIQPSFQRIYLSNRRVVILRSERIGEVNADEVSRYEAAARHYRENYLRYSGIDHDSDKRMIAGVLLSFRALKFTRQEVMIWCAFANLDFTLEKISGALSQLQKDKKHPIKLISGKGPNASWEVVRSSLESYH